MAISVRGSLLSVSISSLLLDNITLLGEEVNPQPKRSLTKANSPISTQVFLLGYGATCSHINLRISVTSAGGLGGRARHIRNVDKVASAAKRMKAVI